MTDTVGRNSESRPAQLKKTETEKTGSVVLNFQTGTYSRSTGDSDSESTEEKNKQC